jgi:hypothetical protein
MCVCVLLVCVYVCVLYASMYVYICTYVNTHVHLLWFLINGQQHMFVRVVGNDSCVDWVTGGPQHGPSVFGVFA